MFRVGQKVWDVLCGPGTVVEVVEYASNYPVVAEFDGMGRKCYTKEGKSNKSLEKPSLYSYPVQVYKEATKPSINWEHVRDKYKFLAQDANGNAWLYGEKPLMGDGRWLASRGDCSEADSYASYTPGIVDWKHSLVVRPQEV